MTAADVFDVVAERCGGQRDAPVGPLTTYRVGGPAAVLATPTGPDDLAALGRLLGEVDPGGEVAVLVVGSGSNLLVADAGVDAVVVHLAEGFSDIDIDLDEGGGRVVAGAAVSMPVLARRSVAAGLSGLEWMVGVPGSVGGAVRMNAGGHGSDVAASLVEVRVCSLRGGQDRVVSATDLDLGYRSSAVAPDDVVVAATFALGHGEVAAGEAELAEIVRWRRANQPGGQNAGSVFANPPGDSSGRLIDAAGCKGMRVGTAEVSHKHANFIQADPGGSADDVFDLMVAVASAVERHHGVVLHPENVLVGFDDRPAPWRERP